VAAPSVVRASSLMPIKAPCPYRLWHLYYPPWREDPHVLADRMEAEHGYEEAFLKLWGMNREDAMTVVAQRHGFSFVF
jgi:hypothetical protein